MSPSGMVETANGDLMLREAQGPVRGPVWFGVLACEHEGLGGSWQGGELATYLHLFPIIFSYSFPQGRPFLSCFLMSDFFFLTIRGCSGLIPHSWFRNHSWW